MGNLVNLHYLDIRGANSIERIPFRIDKLTNLQSLTDFIIGEGDGSYIRGLKYLSNLEGDFRLSGLENVNGEDAGESKLYEKQGIDRLVLHWRKKFENASRNKEVEEWVLDSLCPPKKLEQLVIENYGGAKFSTWIADPSFKNMLSLELHDCKNCKSLPSIGRLLLLKDLSISGLDQVHKIGAEMFGENQSNTFASLESLRFGNMLNWEEWDLCEDDEQVSKFPSLRFLSIRKCPLLLGRLPTILQSLRTLEIYNCKRLVVSISCFPLLRKIWVEGCEELVDEGSLSVQKEQKTIMENEDLRKQVEELRQKRSSNILELNPLLERRLEHSPNNSKADDNNSASDDDNHLSDTSLHLGFPALEGFNSDVISVYDRAFGSMEEKEWLQRLPSKMGNLVNLHYLKIQGKKKVEEWVLDSLHPSKKLEQLVIQNYGGAKFSTWIADSSFKNMLSLELHNCKNCKSLPSIGRLLLLKDLSISGLGQVHKIGAELFGENQSNAFASLEFLRFGNMLNWEEWDLSEDDGQVSKFPSLRFLSIRECPLLLGRLPTILQSLQRLEIYECKRLLVSISSFPLLCELSDKGCEELVDEGSLSVQKVTSLKYVYLSNISKFNISAERIMLRFANSETLNIYGWKELGSSSQNGLSIVGHLSSRLGIVCNWSLWKRRRRYCNLTRFQVLNLWR
ncbi:uncharacterized protein LOC105761660 [Gossypium raimondii]|uniref:uncharacterized protein LOC105761660 n=1 Tax=Gossypium raimondii TaxID=29730 RepID=UPI00227B387F|nr:uncharacterized protein LOC105761660 [Gossypium raimondii]